MKTILLSKGKSMVVDDNQFGWISRFKWHTNGIEGNQYAVHTVRKKEGEQTKYRLHKLLLWCPQGYEIDHVNGDNFDNRLENLRIVTTSQNQANRHKIRGNSSYKGVVFHQRDRKFQASITKNGNRIYLGYFNDEKDAALAYNEKAKELFGQYAYLNKV